MKQVLPIHGPDHVPGGPDPIPGLDAPFIRMILDGAQQTVAANHRDVVEWDVILNDYTETFETSGISGGTDQWAVNILEDGLYALTFRLYLAQVPSNVGIVTELWDIDVDGFSQYQQYHDTTTIYSENGIYGSYIFRNGPSEGDQEIRLVCSNLPTADASVIIDNIGSGTGSYMEIVRLAPAVVAYPYPT